MQAMDAALAELVRERQISREVALLRCADTEGLLRLVGHSQRAVRRVLPAA
jgi:Tfp pilus assembly ATPase PilU